MPANVSIRTAAERTGLTAHVIRAWERRYSLLDPARSEGGHRMYSEADIQRLILMARVVRAGRSIGSVAHLSDSDLLTVLAQEIGSARIAVSGLSAQDKSHAFRANMLAALTQLNARELDALLEQALVTLGWQGVLQLVVAPLAAEIGEKWREGVLTAAHEHLFTHTVKVFLGNLTRQYATSKFSPKILITTPVGQIHELGAVLVAAAAANIGWDTVYLGPNLPAAEIALAAINLNVKVLCLSIVYPDDDPLLADELLQLGRLLPKSVQILAGGRAVGAYEAPLLAIGARLSSGLDELCSILDTLRRMPIASPQLPSPTHLV